MRPLYLQVCFPAQAGLNHLVSNFGWHCWLAWYFDAVLVSSPMILLAREGLADRYETTLSEFIDFSAIQCCGRQVKIVEQVAQDTPRQAMEVGVSTTFEQIEAAAARVREAGGGLLVLNIVGDVRDGIYRNLPAFMQAVRRHGQWSPRTCGFFHPTAAEPRRMAEEIVAQIGEPYTCIHVRRGDRRNRSGWDYYQHTTPDRLVPYLDACGLKRVYLMSDEAPEFFAPLRDLGFQLSQYVDFPELRALVEQRVAGGHMLYAVERELMRQACRRVLTHTRGFTAFSHTDLFSPYGAHDYVIKAPHGPHRPLPELDPEALRKLSANLERDRQGPALYLHLECLPRADMTGQLDCLALICQLAQHLDAILLPPRVEFPGSRPDAGSVTLAEFIDFATLVYRGRPMPAALRLPDGTASLELTLAADLSLQRIESAAADLRANGSGCLVLTAGDAPDLENLPVFRSIPAPAHGLPVWAQTLTYSATAETQRMVETIIEKSLANDPYTCVHLGEGRAMITAAELMEALALCGLTNVYLTADESPDLVGPLKHGGYRVFRHTDFPELRERASRPHGGPWLAVAEHELMRQALWRVRAERKGDQALAYAEQIHPHPDITSRIRYRAERPV